MLARDGDFRQQLMRDGDVFAYAVTSRRFEPPLRVRFSLTNFALSQPMLCGARLQAEVITPAIPIIAGETGFHGTKRSPRLLSFSRVGIVVSKIDKRVGFGFGHVICACDLHTLEVVLKRPVKVL